jgi:hypothetical protein
MKLLPLMLLVGGSLFAETHFSIGIGFGAPIYYAPPPPPAIAYAPSPCPGPGYTWIGGYWYPVGPRYHWHSGYWARPPYAGAYWVAPRYYNQRYYSRYWDRRGGHWDRDNDDDRWEHHGHRWHHGDDDEQ